MVLWRLCSSVTCSWIQPANTPEYAGMPLISFLLLCPSSKGWVSASLYSLDASCWISPWSDRGTDHYWSNSLSPMQTVCHLRTSLWCSSGSLRWSFRHPSLCAAGSGIVSCCRPPVLRNANGCQLQTASHILTPSNSLQRQRNLYFCHMFLYEKRMLRCLSKFGSGYLPKAGLKDKTFMRCI